MSPLFVKEFEREHKCSNKGSAEPSNLRQARNWSQNHGYEAMRAEEARLAGA